MSRRRRRNPNDLVNIILIGGGAFLAWKLGWLAKLGLPGGANGGGGGGGTNITEDQAALIIWQNDANMRAIFGSSHPTWTPLQSVNDWWNWPNVRGGATTKLQYAQTRGWA